MHVTPDLLAEINPQADVRIQVAGETIEPGVFTAPARVRQACRCIIRLEPTGLTPCYSLQTREGFEVTAQVFHPEERLYTLLVVDPGQSLFPRLAPRRAALTLPSRRQTCPTR